MDKTWTQDPSQLIWRALIFLTKCSLFLADLGLEWSTLQQVVLLHAYQLEIVFIGLEFLEASQFSCNLLHNNMCMQNDTIFLQILTFYSKYSKNSWE